jgi:putative membrane protein
VTGPPTTRETREALALLAITAVALVVSGIGPKDRGTWVLETFPVFIAAPLLWFTWDRFRLTPLAYRLICLHALILILGGHYTYAETPLGFWLQDVFGFARNPYDRIGHFAQGFIPAIVAREILVRCSPLGESMRRGTSPSSAGKWLFFLVCCVCLAISAFYEFLEWWSALILGENAEAFLATQGDEWDTQWDMFLALLGAIASQLLFSRLHDGQLRALMLGRPGSGR